VTEERGKARFLLEELCRIAMELKLSASLMCADALHLACELEELERAELEYLHLDIMDGSFVPNYGMGFDLLKQLRQATSIPFDVHMMVCEPERHIHTLVEIGGQIISVHAEATTHLHRTLREIHKHGVKAAVALNPATPLEEIRYVMDEIDMLVIMMVNPGFAGQSMIPGMLAKIAAARNLVEKSGLDIDIQVDGNVSYEHAPEMLAAGANVFVCGTSSIFGQEVGIEQATRRFRRLLETKRA